MPGIYEHDSMFSVRERPWAGLGVTLDKHPKSIDDAIVKAGLDWEVVQRPILIPSEGIDMARWDDDDFDQDFDVEPIPGYYANVREDTGHPLGIVTARYKTVPNIEAFSFLSSIFGTEMQFETAGSLMNGRRVWVLMKIPDWIEVGGDQVAQYAFISNSHDGKSSVLLAVTPVRIICENMLQAAVRRAQQTYSIRHLGDPSKKIAEAAHALDVTVNYYAKFKDHGDKLALTKLADRRAKKLIEELIPMPDDLGDRAMANRSEARDMVMHLFKSGTIVGDLSTVPANAPNTAWALYNAATEYADWYRNERKEGGRFQRAIDDPDGFKHRAWEISCEAAGIK